MPKLTVKILIDPNKNSLTFSKNFRIFSTLEPTSGITEFTDFIEEIITGSPASIDLQYLKRYFRYSRNRMDWSLWYEVEPGNLGEAASIVLEKEENYYFEIKYEYDTGVTEEIDSFIEIHEIKLRFKAGVKIESVYTPKSLCSDEMCTSIVVNRDPSFRPYEVDSSIGIYKDLSYFTNLIYGHQVVYFRTLPEGDSGDYIFKEWTLYKNVDRKCLKVLVPKNAFPSNSPKYTESGIDFILPFEIHIDHRYFQSIFGANSEPRKRDFLYFPLINRMFEIQGSYIHRGFMMTPAFWKVQLRKFNPNIDMLLKDETRHFLDNVIKSAETLFESQVESEIKDATLPDQFKTISTTFDSSRKEIHPDVVIRPLKYTYNFASLIENYYELENITQSEFTYGITQDSPVNSTSIHLENLQSLDSQAPKLHNVILAYQESAPFTAWKNGALRTYDRNITQTSSFYIRARGPFDSIENHIGQSAAGRYIRLEAYRDLNFKDQRNILTETSGSNQTVKFKVRETAIVYNAQPKFNHTDLQNLSFSCLFNVPGKSGPIEFIDGFDNLSQTGFKAFGQFIKYTAENPNGDLTINVQINSQVKTYSISNFISDQWHGLVVSISNEFKQCGVHVYSISEDPSDIINHNGFISRLANTSSLIPVEFNLDQKYRLISSNLKITNLRIFNTMLKQEQHEFILSQQFIRDESMIILIDNCRPQLNIPYITKNR
jgi:hypothetical protein